LSNQTDKQLNLHITQLSVALAINKEFSILHNKIDENVQIISRMLH